jgi:hypothetical protein
MMKNIGTLQLHLRMPNELLLCILNSTLVVCCVAGCVLLTQV